MVDTDPLLASADTADLDCAAFLALLEAHPGPLGNTATFTYDEADNLVEVLAPELASQDAITYGYDRQGFHVSEQLPGEDPVTWVCVGANKLAELELDAHEDLGGRVSLSAVTRGSLPSTFASRSRKPWNDAPG